MTPHAPVVETVNPVRTPKLPKVDSKFPCYELIKGKGKRANSRTDTETTALHTVV